MGGLSAVLIGHLRAVLRRLESLGDEATEQLQGPLAILLGEDLPEPVQGDAAVPSRSRRKRGRSVLPSMVPLPEWRYDEPDTNRRASRKQTPRLPETRTRVDTAQPRASRVCSFCNNHKGSNISGFDIETKRVIPLFNPRRHKWRRHFRWDGPVQVGLTPTGRVTVTVLEINLDYRIDLRRGLVDEGVFPPA
jgi:hypothetical protein